MRASREGRARANPPAGSGLVQQPHAVGVQPGSGPHNLHAVAHCRDLDELFEFTSDRLGALAGLQSMEISPVLRQVKQAGTLITDDRLVAPPHAPRVTPG
ncbi:Lrp/AsnC ligand binding domain-containing protein [Amycolatopsis mediterranei]